MTDLGGSNTWTDLWAECTERLGSSDEARHLIERASGRSGASWLITLTTPAPLNAVDQVQRMIERRLAGEPLQYVLGRWSFRQLDLLVDPRVLIPRPETEQVTGAAIETVAELAAPVVADLGTGSGAIALSVAKEVDEARIFATDTSLDALEVARLNAERLPAMAAQRVTFSQGHWFEALPDDLQGKFDLIVSNPPYVAVDRPDEVEPQVAQWEPATALFAGSDGLDALRHIVDNAPNWLAPGGALVVELAPDQAEPVCRQALDGGFFSVGVGTDLAQRKRWIVATKGK